jgi:hypothetical protein
LYHPHEYVDTGSPCSGVTRGLGQGASDPVVRHQITVRRQINSAEKKADRQYFL